MQLGMNITEGTKEGEAESNMLADRDENYNTRYGGYMGYVMAFERLKLVPRQAPDFDLTQMLIGADVNTAEQIVDHLIQRFLRVGLEAEERSVLVRFLRHELGAERIDLADVETEAALRALLYLVLSTPEYQLA